MTNREQTAADWASRGFSCDLWTDPPGQRWEDFTHATDEVVIVLEGEMEFEVEGEVCHPQLGEELLIPAGAVHSARNIGTTTARWLYGYRQTKLQTCTMKAVSETFLRSDDETKGEPT